MSLLHRRTSLGEVFGALPQQAADLRESYSTLIVENTDLTERQLWGTIAASAGATGNKSLAEAAFRDAGRRLEAGDVEEVRLIAGAMDSGNKEGRLTLRSSRPPDGPPEDFDRELWSLAVAVVNGCAMCMERRERAARERGASAAAILSVARVASMLRAAADILDAGRIAISA